MKNLLLENVGYRIETTNLGFGGVLFTPLVLISRSLNPMQLSAFNRDTLIV